MRVILFFFFDRFVPLLEKKTYFKRKLRTAIKDEELITISSEAFGLLLLKNHWDRWLDIYQKSGGRVSIRGCNKNDSISLLKPKYARGGLMNDKHKDIGTGKGWSIEGIYHFNKLF